jgi:succinyl-CoA synthetase beta subunit
MPGHIDPKGEILRDHKGYAYVKILDQEVKEKVEEVVESKPEEVLIEQYTVDELWDLRKFQQINILKEYGLDKDEIKKLNTEEKRVEKILELQK